jgi:peptidoglycan L-alanyl-D-glutamate endopeptidase CwlK
MDSISEERLALVHPELSRRIHQLADMVSFPFLVTQGLRTFAQQDALYAEGRTAPGRIVTEARGGYSMHNFGLAVDVAPTDGLGGIDWNGKDAKWEEILAKASSCGLAEGAAWRTFPDEPHLYPQEVPASPTDAMRALFVESGLQAVWDSFTLVPL